MDSSGGPKVRGHGGARDTVTDRRDTVTDTGAMANATSTQTAPAPDHLAQVRRLLRQREYRRAIEEIDRRSRHLAGPTPPVPLERVPLEDLRTYAFERLAVQGPGPSSRLPVNLRRGIPVSLRRPVLVDLRRLDHPALEGVLRWLLAGEMRAAEEALRAHDYAAAVTAAELAARIDDRSTRIAYAHARARYELAVAALNAGSTDLDDILGQLQRAARLAKRAAADPALQEPRRKLSVAIVDAVAIVERRRARTARTEAVNELVRRFNRLAQHYSDKDQIVSHIQLGNARASLAQISAEVERLSRRHPADSPAGQVLADLRGQCARYRQHLERLGRSVRAD
jgi:exonuclease VII small subunit